ncbi:hypothetical protein [Bacillus altitudinis]|uniref:hypothetical protein n=1 Tax=Bacillus altitudinis TaxID=293387 RepID=UPI000C247B7F|nr:hypothetical protein [Bacillus altitudinis]PJI13768.1 hypothetical protein CTV96_01405 [Bacillus altitudinis]PKQ86911.1 hypothetical protein CTV98_001955 [Bacillus altitudinis]GJI57358.1 hypothetical protein BATMR_03860 [Bacillus altitudinis]CAI7727508.1 hypothetical protein WT0BACILLUS_00958 [Bacillus altitudinis]
MHFLDRLVKYLEKWGILIILFIVTLCLICLLYFQRDLTLNTFEFFLNEKEGAFLTIGGIFIGIYFAIFSFFIGIKPDSVMADLDDEDILTLVRYLRNSFIGSFVYIFLTLLNFPFFTDVLGILFHFILVASLLYMLLSALKVGIYMYLTFKGDVINLKDNIENARENSYKIQRMLNHFEDFLEEEKRKERELRNERIRNERED